jgi:hypothetical protein
METADQYPPSGPKSGGLVKTIAEIFCFTDAGRFSLGSLYSIEAPCLPCFFLPPGKDPEATLKRAENWLDGPDMAKLPLNTGPDYL